MAAPGNRDAPFFDDEKYLESWPIPFMVRRMLLAVSVPHSARRPMVDISDDWNTDIPHVRALKASIGPGLTQI